MAPPRGAPRGAQLFLDQGERYDWFASSFVTALAVLAAGTLLGFLVRELTTLDPIFDLSVYARNFAAGSLIMLVLMIGSYSSMVLLALFTQGRVHDRGPRAHQACRSSSLP